MPRCRVFVLAMGAVLVGPFVAFPFAAGDAKADPQSCLAMTPAEVAATIRFSDEFDGGINEQVWNAMKFHPDRVRFVTAPVRSGSESLRAEVGGGLGLEPASDAGPSTERNELRERDDRRLPMETEIWYGFSFLVPADMPPIDRRLVLAQVKQRLIPTGYSTASEYDPERNDKPVIAIRLAQSDPAGDLSVNISVEKQPAEHRVDILSAAVQKSGAGEDRWVDVIWRFKLSPRWDGVPPADKVPALPGAAKPPAYKGDGFIEAWLFQSDRFLAHAFYDGPFGYPNRIGCPEFKLGPYRDAGDRTWTIYFDAVRRGTSFADVAPSGISKPVSTP